MNLIELQRTGKIEVIEQQGERWNLDDLLAMPEAHDPEGMAGDDAAEYRLYDAAGEEVRPEELNPPE